MNNSLRIVVITAIAVLTLTVLSVGFAFAQAATPWGSMMDTVYGGMMGGYARQDGTPGAGYGPGMLGSGGMMDGNFGSMQAMHTWMSQTGGIHTLVWDALAERLGLTSEELQAELANGRTLAEMAEGQGLAQADLAGALESAMKAGLEQAVADGVVTRAQADQMLSAMAGRYAWMITYMGSGMGPGFGPGGCHNTAPTQTNL